MTQEEKELLLKDLCGRLPYQPLCKKVDTEDDFCECNGPLGYSLRDLIDNKIIIKPYLRSMSSMTEEEIVEINSMGFAYWTTMINNDLRTRGPMSLLDAIITHHKMVKLIDWLNAHHFDYRGLIEKGLALEASEEIYNK